MWVRVHVMEQGKEVHVMEQGDHIFVCTTRTLLVGLAFGRLVVSGSAAGKSGKGRQGLRLIK